MLWTILVLKGRAPYGQHQESRPLGRSNTGSPRFTDFPSLYACSESSLTNLIGWEYETNSLRMFRKSDPPRGFLVLTKRSAASGDENGYEPMRPRPHFAGGIWKRRFTLNTHQMFSVHTKPEKFENATVTGLLDLCLRKSRPGKSHDYRDAIVFEKLGFQNGYRPH